MSRVQKSRRTTMKLKVLLAPVLVFAMLAGCSEPVKDYSYHNLNRLKGWAKNQPVTLEVQMPDSTKACQLYIVGEIKTKRTIDKEKGYPINILFTAPDSLMYRDSVNLPVNVVTDNTISRTSHGIRVIEWPYRKNIHNTKPGKWSITLTHGDTTENYSNIIGIGVYCKQK